MNNQLKKTIEEEIAKMPIEIQSAINSVDWITVSEEIGKKHLLDEEDIVNVQTEIVYVLIGIEHITSLATNIEYKINISKNESEKISLEILEKICQPIAEKLTENIKNTIKDKKTTWQQNINFILSGGDYSVFLQRAGVKNDFQDTQNPAPASIQININHSKLEDLKDNFTI